LVTVILQTAPESQLLETVNFTLTPLEDGTEETAGVFEATGEGEITGVFVAAGDGDALGEGETTGAFDTTGEEETAGDDVVQGKGLNHGKNGVFCVPAELLGVNTFPLLSSSRPLIKSSVLK
jgi:hypothetical protein